MMCVFENGALLEMYGYFAFALGLIGVGVVCRYTLRSAIANPAAVIVDSLVGANRRSMTTSAALIGRQLLSLLPTLAQLANCSPASWRTDAARCCGGKDGTRCTRSGTRPSAAPRTSKCRP